MTFAFESFQHFLNMGGYAFNVWASFAVALISMLILTVVIWGQDRATKQLVRRQAQLLTPRKENTTKSD